MILFYQLEMMSQMKRCLSCLLHNPNAYTIKVGNGGTFAKYKVAISNDVMLLLKQLSRMRITLAFILSIIFAVGLVAFGFTFYQSSTERGKLINELEIRTSQVAEEIFQS